MGFDISPGLISIKTVSLSTIITFFIGIAVAYWMTNYNGKLRNILDTIFTLPLVLPPTVVGFFLLLIFGKNGPAGKLLLKMGTTLIFSWPATVVAATIVAFPLMYRTTKGAFEQIDNNVVNAAKTLGVSDWKIFWRVMIPMAWPGIAAAAVLSFARALGEFGATLMVAGNIPNKTQTIPVAIYFAAENGEMGTAFIWVILIVLISTVVIFLMNYWNEHQQKNIYGVRRK
ncbi:MAG: molybdate ABC transporter permease subunit [Clostridium tyrobutyricum]|jgi:molybdate transport system permease protein|uniref:molybdate ABC transporter permease subunit n=1 Tax=Clostridium tyrobutyricum TaxID=1519 RepID=UPI002430CA1A|nr:molybdate ABC transporter permease subunit [Clostridium tyrobutyricum]MCH4237998.1 molybdate ABC transporter permease subunit [Clostridium tyrobutyricum]MCH4258623.1 molybdate ABC transporter permease subunit [Clostridium tyrobutyricum]MCI1239373.1 molybdate ABC transporter permease subunit [Clostridium tyrobutyricum]MCI1652763.1 molybdate ABC transporter permease subunit [Clostridium tyrobutyricum]MCI1937115.1 molybdate ABC transporter permease subunit [Clostridium tyrobutyricum]